MEDWKFACEEVLRLSSKLGIESDDLSAAIERDSVDDALTALSPLLLMLEGAVTVIAYRVADFALIEEASAIRTAAMHAFEVATGVDCPPMAFACSVGT